MRTLTSTVPISTYGGASGTTIVWRHRGEMHLTVVLKTAFSLVHDSLAEVLPGAEILREETRVSPSDLVPKLASPEVIVVGHACAPEGTATTSLAVRLFVGGETPVLDKTVHVYGDRARSRPEPQPFSRIPLVYERTVGGPSTDNPVGRAATDPTSAPNVVDPSDPWKPAGFGPITEAWPLRRRHVRSALPVLRDGIFVVPDDLDLEFFQAAPLDQRVTKLANDDWIVIDGMHPIFTRFQCQLPGARARARLTGPDPTGTSTFLPTRLDRLLIDMDALVVCATWRAHVPVIEGTLAGRQVVAGIEIPEDEAIAEESSQTMIVDGDELPQLGGGALPFSGPSARRSSPGKGLGGLPFGRKDPAPAAMTAPAAPRAPTLSTATAAIPAIEWAAEETVTAMGSERQSLPFIAGAGEKPPPSFGVPSLVGDDEGEGGTAVAPIPSELMRAALPFEQRGAAAGAPSAPAVVPPPAFGPPPAVLVPPAVVVPQAVAPQAVVPQAVVLPVVASAPQELLKTVTIPVVPDTGDAPALAVTPAPASAPVIEESVTSPEVAVAPEPPSTQPGASPTDPGMPDVGSPEQDSLREQVIAKIRAGEAFLGAALAGVDLAGLDLKGVRFSEADLAGAKLAGADLTGAKLPGAKLAGADLKGAKLVDADLARADLTRAVLDAAILEGADLTAAVLTMASGEGASFSRAKCERASFAQGRWARAKFENAAMPNVDFSGARVDGASFANADLADARFNEARGEDCILKNAKLDGVGAAGAALPGIDLSGASADRSNWEGAEIDRGSFDGCSLKGASFSRASLVATTARKAILDDADLSNISADGMDLSEASLSRANLRQAKLGGAKMSRANLVDANLQRVTAADIALDAADLKGASLRFAKLRGADLAGAQVDGADLRDANLEGSCLTGVDRSKAKMAGANLKSIRE